MKLSVSRLKCFEACRYAYKFKYIEKLEPVQKPDALQVGTNYHEKIEELYSKGEFSQNEYNKETAMAVAYKKYIYPKFKVKAVEEWFEKPFGNGKHILTGRVDGVAEDGHLVEHKTTGIDNLEEYEFDLQWDEQILAYMYGYDVRSMWYTIVKKPTIRQKKDETDEEFFRRMCEWYDTDTDSKIRVVEITRTDEEIEEFVKRLDIIADEMDHAEKEEKYLYRNPSHCRCWGRRCEYSSICLNYDPDIEYIEFVKSE